MHLKIEIIDESVKCQYEKVLADGGTQHEGDSGFDLFIAKDTIIEPEGTALVGLGIKAAAFKTRECVNSVAYMVMPRSSVYKTPLRQCNSIGLIDASYRGELRWPVDHIKSSQPAFTAKGGERLCQAVAFNGEGWTFELVDSLGVTERGEGGFGSTNSENQIGEKRPCPKD